MAHSGICVSHNVEITRWVIRHYYCCCYTPCLCTCTTNRGGPLRRGTCKTCKLEGSSVSCVHNTIVDKRIAGTKENLNQGGLPREPGNDAGFYMCICRFLLEMYVHFPASYWPCHLQSHAKNTLILCTTRVRCIGPLQNDAVSCADFPQQLACNVNTWLVCWYAQSMARGRG